MAALTLELLIDKVVFEYPKGKVFEGDTYIDLMEQMMNGYTLTDDPIGRMLNRIIFLRSITAAFQGYLALEAGYMPDELWARGDMVNPVEMSSWEDPNVPYVIVTEAQLDFPVPKGNIIEFSSLNEKKLVESMVDAGMARLTVGPDYQPMDYPEIDYWPMLAK